MERAYRQGLPLPAAALLPLLQSYSRSGDIASSRTLHSLLIARGILSPPGPPGNHLIRLLASHGTLLEANLVFCHVGSPCVYAWHAIISAHSAHGCHEIALALFSCMQESGLKAGKCTFLCILKACGCIGAIAQGMVVHAQVVYAALESGLSIGSTLIDMYSKCGNFEEAYNIFEGLLPRDLICWSSMIAGCIRSGQDLVALDLFEKMKGEGVKADRPMLLCVLKACSNLGATVEGMLMHGQIIEDMVELDDPLSTMLVDMYTRCGNLEDAQRVFNSLSQPDVVLWSALITGYNQYGWWHDTIRIFNRMLAEELKPDNVLLTSVLKAWGNIGDIKNGVLLHEWIVQGGFELDVSIQLALINMYIKFGNLEDAHGMFEGLPEKNLPSWNMMLAIYGQYGRGHCVVRLYQRMLSEGIEPDKHSLTHVLKACGITQDIEGGKLIHEKVNSLGLQYDLSLANAVIDMYIKCGRIEIGHQVFDDLPIRNVMTWNLIIAGHTQHDHETIACKLFEKMEDEGMIPDNITFSCIARVCGIKGSLVQGKLIHNKVVLYGNHTDPFIGSAIINMYAQCGALEDAHEVFDELPVKNAVCWNIIIGEYVRVRDGLLALQLFERMQEDGIHPDKVTFLCILKACGIAAACDTWQHVNIIYDLMVRNKLENDLFLASTLVDVYAKSGNLEAASNVFNQVSHRNAVTWNTLISGYAELDEGLVALDLLQKMQSEGIEPEKATFLVALKSCASIGSVQQGRLIHDEIIRRGLEIDVTVGSAVVNTYAKCGCLQEAWKSFEKLPNQDLILWNTLIAGYAHQGDNELAQKCFHEIQNKGMRPANGSFISLLTACSHVAEVDEGCSYFGNMDENQQSLLHFTCMIDLLGRSGCIEKALEMLETMPKFPDITVWLALLTSCKKYGNVNLAKECFVRICSSNENVAAGYLFISDIYADSDLLEAFQETQELHGFNTIRMNPETPFFPGLSQR